MENAGRLNATGETPARENAKVEFNRNR